MCSEKAMGREMAGPMRTVGIVCGRGLGIVLGMSERYSEHVWITIPEAYIPITQGRRRG